MTAATVGLDTILHVSYLTIYKNKNNFFGPELAA